MEEDNNNNNNNSNSNYPCMERQRPDESNVTND